MTTIYRSRPCAIAFVLLSPLIAVACFFAVLIHMAFDGVRELYTAIRVMLTDEIPSFFREDVGGAYRWAILQPILGAYAAANVALSSFRRDLSYYGTDLKWTFRGFLAELRLFVVRDKMASWFWVRRSFEDFLEALRGPIRR